MVLKFGYNVTMEHATRSHSSVIMSLYYVEQAQYTAPQFNRVYGHYGTNTVHGLVVRVTMEQAQ